MNSTPAGAVIHRARTIRRRPSNGGARSTTVRAAPCFALSGHGTSFSASPGRRGPARQNRRWWQPIGRADPLCPAPGLSLPRWGVSATVRQLPGTRASDLAAKERRAEFDDAGRTAKTIGNCTAHVDDRRRRVRRRDTPFHVPTTWRRKGILPALPKQLAEMYLSPFPADQGAAARL